MSNYKGFVKSFPWDDLGVVIMGKVRDGKDKIEMISILEDAKNGTGTTPRLCRDAKCSMRYANNGTFPHPVHAAWFIKSMAYFLANDKPGKNGLYDIVRYRHRDWKMIKEFDETTDNPGERTRRFVGERKIVLYPITPSKKLGADRHNRQSSKRHSAKPTGRVAKPKGMKARGIIYREWLRERHEAGARA